MEPVYGPVIRLAKVLFAYEGLRFTRTGSENIPASGGAVIVINHTGYMDFTYAGYSALDVRRYIRFMAKKEVFDNRISGPLMRGMKHIPVDRAAGGESYRRAVADLRAGELVGVFPEATISRSFELKGFKTGAARMAAEAQVPIVPVVIWGSQRIWTKGHPKRLGRTKFPLLIRTGEPISPEGDPEQVMDTVKAAMSGLLARLREDYAAYLPGGTYPAGEYWVPASLGGGAPTLDEATALDDADSAARAAARAEREAQAGPAGQAGPVGRTAQGARGAEGEAGGTGVGQNGGGPRETRRARLAAKARRARARAQEMQEKRRARKAAKRGTEIW